MEIRQFSEHPSMEDPDVYLHDDEDSLDPYCPKCRVRWMALDVDDLDLKNSLPAIALAW